MPGDHEDEEDEEDVLSSMNGDEKVLLLSAFC